MGLLKSRTIPGSRRLAPRLTSGPAVARHQPGRFLLSHPSLQGYIHRGCLLHHRWAAGYGQRVHLVQPQHRRPGDYQGAAGSLGGTQLLPPFRGPKALSQPSPTLSLWGRSRPYAQAPHSWNEARVCLVLAVALAPPCPAGGQPACGTVRRRYHADPGHHRQVHGPLCLAP